MNDECPKCGEEMSENCDTCSQKACSLCGCPLCDQSIPVGQEIDGDEM